MPALYVANRPPAVSALSRSYMGTGVTLRIFQAADLDNFTAIHGKDDSTSGRTHRQRRIVN
jgi:hypothetical protein